MSYETVYKAMNNLDKSVKYCINVTKSALAPLTRDQALLQEHAAQTDETVDEMKSRIVCLEEANRYLRNSAAQAAKTVDDIENRIVNLDEVSDCQQNLCDRLNEKLREIDARLTKHTVTCCGPTDATGARHDCEHIHDVNYNERHGFAWPEAEERHLANAVKVLCQHERHHHRRSPRAVALRIRDIIEDMVIDEL